MGSCNLAQSNEGEGLNGTIDVWLQVHVFCRSRGRGTCTCERSMLTARRRGRPLSQICTTVRRPAQAASSFGTVDDKGNACQSCRERFVAKARCQVSRTCLLRFAAETTGRGIGSGDASRIDEHVFTALHRAAVSCFRQHLSWPGLVIITFRVAWNPSNSTATLKVHQISRLAYTLRAQSLVCKRRGAVWASTQGVCQLLRSYHPEAGGDSFT